MLYKYRCDNILANADAVHHQAVAILPVHTHDTGSMQDALVGHNVVVGTVVNGRAICERDADDARCIGHVVWVVHIPGRGMRLVDLESVQVRFLPFYIIGYNYDYDYIICIRSL